MDTSHAPQSLPNTSSPPTHSTSARPITRLLVANRGEIARRIFSTASHMGITTVAVYSDPDAHSPHVLEADLSVRLPGSTPTETYLRADLLLEAARASGADAIHPGYGFLSESAEFARAVVDAGYTWVGPPAPAIEAMGSKIGSKDRMRSAGVPTLDSITVDGDAYPAIEAVDALGWPVLVKASAGGGGRGMRIVEGPGDLAEALDSARREAASAFGDATVFLERYVTSPRHIEVQVLADTHGSVVALFERECSIQRRHQKIIEEAPSPAVGPELRARLSEAAVAAARAVGYVNAGTVEFVVDAAGEPAFLEMNTRLQVEHPVTEEVSGLDLVRLQLLVASGAPLPDEVHAAVARGPVGHAIEVRLYAEDPGAGWRPSTGRLERFEIDRGRPGIRVDSGVRTGDIVSPHYDPMLAKVIVHAPTRSEAGARLAAALAGAHIHGVTTNRDLLVRTLRHPDFVSGHTDTGFLERHGLTGPQGLASPLADASAIGRHALAAALAAQAARRREATVLAGLPSGWRGNPWDHQEVSFAVGDRTVSIAYRLDRRRHRSPDGDPRQEVTEALVDGVPADLTVLSFEPDNVVIEASGVTRSYAVHLVGTTAYVDGPDGSSRLEHIDRLPEPAELVVEGSSLAPMPGNVVRVAVALGDTVATGATLVVLEAMKMAHAVRAPSGGTVSEIAVSEGDQVETGQILVVVDVDGDATDATTEVDTGA